MSLFYWGFQFPRVQINYLVSRYMEYQFEIG